MVQTIIVNRDYSQGALTRFEEAFPPLLEGKVTPEEYRHTIERVNEYFLEAESVDFKTFMEGCLGYTGSSEDGGSGLRGALVLVRFNQFLRNENERVYRPKGVEWVNPLNNGLLHIDLLVQN